MKQKVFSALKDWKWMGDITVEMLHHEM